MYVTHDGELYNIRAMHSYVIVIFLCDLNVFIYVICEVFLLYFLNRTEICLYCDVTSKNSQSLYIVAHPLISFMCGCSTRGDVVFFVIVLANVKAT